jgi:hypothetical protein
LVASAVQWAERIMRKIDSVFFGLMTPRASVVRHN